MSRIGKQLLTLAALVVMVTSLAACGSPSGGNPTPTPAPATSTPLPAMTPTTAAATMVPPTATPMGQSADCLPSHLGTGIKVGLVTDTGGLNDKSFNHLACVGLTNADRQLSIDGQVLQSTSPADYVPNLTRFAQQGKDLVIAVGFLMNDAVVQVAKQYPNTHFAIIDDVLTDKSFNVIKPPLKNVAELVFTEQECGALVGYMSALLEADGTMPGLQKKAVISTIGGLAIPPVNHYINGYIWGAHQADKETGKKTKVLVGWNTDTANPFTDSSAANRTGLADIANGSDFLFQVDGGAGLGYLDAAKSKSLYGIGVDADQNYLGMYVIASALKRVDTAVFDTIQMVQAGTFVSTISTTPIQSFSLKNDGVGFSYNTNVPTAIVTKVQALAAQIKAGTMTVPATWPGYYAKGVDSAPTCKGTIANPC